MFEVVSAAERPQGVRTAGGLGAPPPSAPRRLRRSAAGIGGIGRSSRPRCDRFEAFQGGEPRPPASRTLRGPYAGADCAAAAVRNPMAGAGEGAKTAWRAHSKAPMPLYPLPDRPWPHLASPAPNAHQNRSGRQHRSKSEREAPRSSRPSQSSPTALTHPRFLRRRHGRPRMLRQRRLPRRLFYAGKRRAIR